MKFPGLTCLAGAAALALTCCTTSPQKQGINTAGKLSPQETNEIINAAANLASTDYVGKLADAVGECYENAKDQRGYEVCMAFDAAATRRFENLPQTGTHLHPVTYFSATRLTERLQQFSSRGFGSQQATIDWMSENLDVIVTRSNTENRSYLKL